MSRIAILLPDGTGLKNYIYSDLMPKIYAKGWEVVLISDFSESIIHEIEALHGIKIENVHTPPYRESLKERFYRELEACSRVRRNARVSHNKTILDFWKNKGKTFPQWLFYKVISILSRWYGRGNKVEFLSKKYLSLVRTKEAEKVLSENHIDVLFCTHQRAYSAATLFKAAKNLDVRTYTVIYSWDNMPKGRLPFRADYYIVWSDWMKKEFELYYPDINLEKVVITGTPQFEFYNKKEWLISREEFCRQIGVNSSRKIICYSGDDTLTSPFDPVYLDDLAATIQSIDTKNELAIILRRCPVDMSGRFDAIVKKYPGLIYVSDPIWIQSHDGGWQGIYPSINDVKLLCNIAFHCDAVYNVGSTMAFDFCMFGHPAYFINYDTKSSKCWSTQTIYKFQHFRSMPSVDCVHWVNGKEQLVQLMSDFLHANNPIQTKAKEWFGIINSGAIGGAPSDKIAYLLTGK